MLARTRGTRPRRSHGFGVRRVRGGGRTRVRGAHANAGHFDLNVTGCRYAEFYKEIGAPELGFLLVCTADFAMAEGFGSGVQLTRTRTIMQGASYCDFRYVLKEK